MSCDPQQCNDVQEKGTSLAVYNGDDCTHKLSRPRDMRGQAIAVQSTEKSVGLMNGSEKYPFIFPGLMKENSNQVRRLLIQTSSGQFKSWDAGNFFGNNKLSVKDGAFIIEEDLMSDMFKGDICQADCGAVSSALGVKRVIYTCPGKPDRTVWQICRIPTCCCAGAEAEETCDACADFDSVLTNGEIVV